MNLPFDKIHCADDLTAKRLFTNFQHSVLCNASNLQSVVDWCDLNFGKSVLTYSSDDEGYFHIQNKDGVWEFWSNVFYFTNKSDAMLFKVTWHEMCD